ncbi:hypothetical protein ACFY0F_07035 [Streptomyces sp. NPDC001544]|uniref:hypothetical protein n=1 Tax=Streptomyces sp. NPDC001544 TaxID=3364584 RepID=UPI0036CDBC07
MASLYPLWELGRVHRALVELVIAWNEQYEAQQKAEHAEYYRKRHEKRDKP